MSCACAADGMMQKTSGHADGSKRAARQAAGKAASRAIRGGRDLVRSAGGDGADDKASIASLTRVSGIGPKLAQRLRRQGIESYDELREVFIEQRGGDKKRMLGWMLKSMPGAGRISLAKAAKGMADEWLVVDSGTSSDHA